MSVKKSQSKSPLFSGGILTAASIIIVLWIFPVLIHHFELKITDLKFNLRSYLANEPDLDPNIIMVNLDDYAKKQSEYDLWPYPYYAETIEKINAGGPTSLGIDIFFTISVDTSGWQRLLTAIDNSFVSVNPYMVEFGDKNTFM